MSELFEAAEEAVDELFTPRQGGLVDRHRARKAAEEAKLAEAENTAERIEQPSYKAVKVAIESPDIISPNVFNIPAGVAAQILPLSMYRYRSTIRVVTAASSVVLAKDQGAAISQNGFPVLTADPPLVINARAQVWAFNPGGATVQVCVIAEIYGPEQK